MQDHVVVVLYFGSFHGFLDDNNTICFRKIWRTGGIKSWNDQSVPCMSINCVIKD